MENACLRSETCHPALHLVLNTGHITTVKVEQLMTEALEFCTLDYMHNPAPNVAGKLVFRANRDGMAYGICVWFETELYEDIGFSAGPESEGTIYGQWFLPWVEPVVN